MAIPANTVSRTAVQALTDYSDAFARALVSSSFIPWAAKYGYVHTTNALQTRWPIPLDAAGYKELKGDIKFRKLYHRRVTLETREWQDGVSAKAREIEAPDFIDWAGQPQAMAEAWAQHPNIIAAAMLAEDTYNGPLLDLYADPDTNAASTRRLFATDHPYNVLKTSLGTFNNTLTTTVADITNGSVFDSLAQHFRSMKNARGRGMGLRLGSLLVPAARDQLFKRALEPDNLVRVIQEASANVGGVPEQNIHKGLAWDSADELQSDDYFYAFSAPKPGMYPWVMTTRGAPEEIMHDKDSHMYKTSREVGMAYVGEMEVGAVLPHCIVRIQITG